MRLIPPHRRAPPAASPEPPAAASTPVGTSPAGARPRPSRGRCRRSGRRYGLRLCLQRLHRGVGGPRPAGSRGSAGVEDAMGWPRCCLSARPTARPPPCPCSTPRAMWACGSKKDPACRTPCRGRRGRGRRREVPRSPARCWSTAKAPRSYRFRKDWRSLELVTSLLSASASAYGSATPLRAGELEGQPPAPGCLRCGGATRPWEGCSDRASGSLLDAAGHGAVTPRLHSDIAVRRDHVGDRTRLPTVSVTCVIAIHLRRANVTTLGWKARQRGRTEPAARASVTSQGPGSSLGAYFVQNRLFRSL